MKVLVTDATRNVGCSAIHALVKEGHEIIATDTRHLPFGVKSRFASKFYQTPEHDDDDYPQAIWKIIEKSRPDVILPVLNCRWFVENIHEIKKKSNILYPEYPIFLQAFNNQYTHQTCHSLNIPAPKLFEQPEAEAYLETAKGKGIKSVLVIKPCLDFGGARGVKYITNAEDLSKELSLVESLYGNVFIQEYIPGDEKSMIALNLIFAENAELVASFAFRKLRQWPRNGGTTAIGISISPEPYLDMIMPFFKKLYWRGPVDVEIKIDSRDQIPKLIEINPRFSGALAFAVHLGINLPHLYCIHANKEKNSKQAQNKTYQEGFKYVNKSQVLKSSIDAILTSKNKFQELKSILQDCKGKKFNYVILHRDYLFRFSKYLFELPQLFKSLKSIFFFHVRK